MANRPVQAAQRRPSISPTRSKQYSARSGVPTARLREWSSPAVRDKLDAIVPGQLIKDAKTRLQEYLQADGTLPAEILAHRNGRRGPCSNFASSARSDRGNVRTEEVCRDAERLEQIAAERALERLQQP